MVKALNKEIFKIAIPSILANITVPIVGMVDIAVAGHLTSNAATLIGGIAIGSLLFDLVYWNFSFLRVGTGGMTAQACGRKDFQECANLLTRGVGIALISAFLFLLLQWFVVQFAFLFIDCTEEVKTLAVKYFHIRILAAPATLSLMAFRGWFIGMQDGVSPMIIDLVVNFGNIFASILFALGFSFISTDICPNDLGNVASNALENISIKEHNYLGWKGLGFDGIAWGTVFAQYSGLLTALLLVLSKYWGKLKTEFRSINLKTIFKGSETRKFFTMNIDLVVRSLSFVGIYIGFTIISAKYGDITLAVSSIMMKLLLLFSYFTDGFAYAGEALTGKYIGAKDIVRFKKTVNYTFIWSAAVCLLFVAIYYFGGDWLLKIMTSDREVIAHCSDYMIWLFFMPIMGCAAFTWDGIYIGATASKAIRDSMVYSTIAFLLCYFIMELSIKPNAELAVHLLLTAYYIHLVIRSAILTLRYKKEILYRYFPFSSNIPR